MILRRIPIIIMGMVQALPCKMKDAKMLKIIREIAENTSRVYILKHAKVGMQERKISQTQIYSCLQRKYCRAGAVVCIWRLEVHHAPAIRFMFASHLNLKKTEII